VIFAQEEEQEKQQDSKTEPQEEVKIKLADKQVLRKGNDLYKEKKFADAEAKYKKALMQNQYYKTAYYNLSNSMYSQDKFKESLPGYELVVKTTDDKEFKAQSFHNIGNVLMKAKQYAKAISAYKNSLRLNPKDDETRYNLALAQDLLEKQQNQENKDNKDDKDNKDNKDKNKDNKDQNNENKKEKGDDNKDQDQDKGEDNKDKEDQDKGGDNEQENKQQPKPEPNKLTQQQIQQLLEAMNNEENKTQKKVNAKKASGKKVKQEKDW
jgi:tetratricopeptide (TPR) repeat protein